MGSATPPDVVTRRLRAQLLSGPVAGGPANVVRHLGAVQSQELELGLWSVGQRSAASRAAVLAALDAGTVLRTHVLRPTWHCVAAEDLRWLQAVTGARVGALARSHARRAGVDDELLRRCLPVIAAALAGGAHRSRREIRDALAGHGVDVPPALLAHVLLAAELGSVITSGPLRGGRPTYALGDERIPRGPDLAGEQALAELARRYLRGHGPATERDLAWWASLTLGHARLGIHLIRDELDRIDVDGVTYLTAADQSPAPAPAAAHLLQPFDELVVGYQRQSRALSYADPRASRDPNTRRHPLLLGTSVRGWWWAAARPTDPVRVGLDMGAAESYRQPVLNAVAGYARFVGRTAAIDWATAPR